MEDFNLIDERIKKNALNFNQWSERLSDDTKKKMLLSMLVSSMKHWDKYPSRFLFNH
jgi:hypothetical protein